MPKPSMKPWRTIWKRISAVFLLGEDIGKYAGIFQVTAGLLDKFGPERVIDTPISEAAFHGGCRRSRHDRNGPIVEIMFIDFTTACMDMIVNQMAKIHYMFGDGGKFPWFCARTSARDAGRRPNIPRVFTPFSCIFPA